MRGTAKELREQEAAQKRLQKQEALIARKANQQLQNKLKSIKKAQKKVIKATAQSKKDTVDQDIVEDTVIAPERSNRRGRQITLPERYRK